MNRNQTNARLGWLTSLLCAQRTNLEKVFLRLKGIGVRAGTSLMLHRKFMRLMQQVAADKEKELDLLNEIEAIEKKHQELKNRKMLRSADPKMAEEPILKVEDVPEEKPKRVGLLTIFGLLYLFSSKPIKHKNQDLTVD